MLSSGEGEEEQRGEGHRGAAPALPPTRFHANPVPGPGPPRQSCGRAGRWARSSAGCEAQSAAPAAVQPRGAARSAGRERRGETRIQNAPRWVRRGIALPSLRVAAGGSGAGLRAEREAEGALCAAPAALQVAPGSAGCAVRGRWVRPAVRVVTPFVRVGSERCAGAAFGGAS